MFHQPEGPLATIRPVPLHAYALLRETLLPQVLETKTTSGNPSSYGGGVFGTRHGHDQPGP